MNMRFVPIRAINFVPNVQPSCGTHPAYRGTYCRCVNRQVREARHLPVADCCVKKAWSYTSTPLFLLISFEHRDFAENPFLTHVWWSAHLPWQNLGLCWVFHSPHLSAFEHIYECGTNRCYVFRSCFAMPAQLSYVLYANPLKTKRRPLYLKTQFVPRSKHFSSRL